VNRFEVDAPDGVCGAWRVESFTIGENQSKATLMRALYQNNPLEYVAPGNYKRLMRDDVVVMSNTQMEIATNRGFVRYARGRVLINGLGLGMVLQAILRKPEVTHVTVVEISKEVIELVGPSFSHDPRVKIVCADALTYCPAPGERFDAVWHDIWDNITPDNLPDMDLLHRRYGRCTHRQESWGRAQCEKMAKRSRALEQALETYPRCRAR
jgi:hypothetical protein